MNKAYIRPLAFGIGAYLIATALSYLLFTYVIFNRSAKLLSPASESTKSLDGRTAFDDTLPKTEECPLNGAMYSKPQKQWWSKHGPLGIMIENHEESRPQSGLSSADVVYEAVAEGGITRFLAVFYCQDAGMVGPVRSARTYFLDFISEYGDFPLYAHVGGANTPGPANALGQIDDYGWGSYNDLNQFSIGFPTYWRDYDRLGHEVATEHTMYSTTQKLWDFASTKRKLTNVDEDGKNWDANFRSYTFKNDASKGDRPASQTVSFDFWKGYGAYSVRWDYDPIANTYLRVNGGAKHLDKNNGKQLSAKNVVLLFMRESRANDGYEGNLHMLYGTKGTGKASVFLDGKEIDATWSKKNRTARLILADTAGKEIQFNKGQIWFEILGTGSEATVK